MTITPIDIQKKEFHRSFRGYNEEEVKDFLEKITLSYEMIYKENQDLKEKVQELEEKLKQYRDLEDTLKKAVVMAEKTAEEVKANAQKERDLIIKQAVVKANQILQNTETRCNAMLNQYEEIRRQFLIYKTRFINFLQSQMDLINSCELEDKEQNFNDFIREAATSKDFSEIDSQNENSFNSNLNVELNDDEDSDMEEQDIVLSEDEDN